MEPISNFSKEGKIGKLSYYTHVRNGVIGTCPVPRRTVAGLDLVVGVRACTPCAIRGNGGGEGRGGERTERVDERGVRPEHVTPDSYTDCCYGINL